MTGGVFATEPDCPNCGTRCGVIRGHYACRVCKVFVIESTSED